MTSTMHRGATIISPEVPGAPVIWTHSDSHTQGEAETVEAARQQVNRHLGSPDPDCSKCRGSGYQDWAHLAIDPCAICWGDA